jgi:pimeloyl-ACP methyl ester carboxylesterase
MRESAEDTAQLADHLGIDRFALLGWSGGGMHALAAARYLGERVTHVVTVATPAPFDQPGATKSMHWLAVLPYRLRHVPPLRGAWFALLAGQGADPSAYVDGVMRFFGPEDRAVFADPAFRPRLELSYAEVWAQGPTGADSDHAIISQLDFRLSDVRQHVAVYQGRSDTFVRPSAATRLASLLPDAEVHLIPGGHLCVFTQWTELLSAVAGRAHLSTG